MDTLRGTLLQWKKAPADGRSRGFAVVNYETGTGLTPTKVGGFFPAGMKPGDWFIAHGEWKTNVWKGVPEEVFNARTIRPDLPMTKAGARDLLLRTFSAEEHGIEADAIRRFVEEHGDECARRVERDPELLLSMSSDPERFRSAILRDWGRRNSGRAAVVLLEQAKFTPKMVDAVLDAYRDDAINIIKANPYQLVALPEVGFDSADKLGGLFNIPDGDPRRVTAAVADAISRIDTNGHTFIPVSEVAPFLVERRIVPEYLRATISARIGKTDVATRLRFDILDGAAIAQQADIGEAEQTVAREVARLVGRRMPDALRSRIEAATSSVLSDPKYERLDDVQRDAVARSARESIAILTGGPGTGKSSVTKAIADIAESVAPGSVILLAPTGKAARRLEEATGRPASTVHSGLGSYVDGGRHVFRRNRQNPLKEGCFVIVDEASMLDVETAAALLEALPPDGRLLLVGDRFQLPSVGPGYVLGDLLAASAPNGLKVPSSELAKVYRQDAGSGIATGAALVKEGKVPALDNKFRGGVAFFEHRTPQIVDRICSMILGPVQRQLRLDPRKEVAILCPQAPGPAGTWEINTRLSAELNPDGASIPGVALGPNDPPKMPVPRVGDRVMLTKNEPEKKVMNGDVGTITGTHVVKVGSREQTMIRVEFDSGPVADFPVSRWRDLILAYAITGHKSQGSQYKMVIMPMTTAHSKMLERTLVYTEWTRAEDFLVLVGEREAFEMAVERVTATHRRTRLKAFLEENLAKLDVADASEYGPSMSNATGQTTRRGLLSRRVPPGSIGEGQRQSTESPGRGLLSRAVRRRDHEPSAGPRP